MRPESAVLPIVLVIGLLACGGGGSSAGPDDDGDDTPWIPCLYALPQCEQRIQIGDGVFLPIYTTFPLDVGSETTTRALIVIHGAGRDADSYFGSGVIATSAASDPEETVVVAPRFQTLEDGPRANEVWWSEGGWKRGHLSRVEGPRPRVSSYEAIDVIVRLLGNTARFPELREVVIAGHSAGGQVVHRYASGTPVEDELPGLDFLYVVTNPSTYLYLGPERWDGAGFSSPDPEPCPDYQSWHYGLEDLNSYMSRPSLLEIDRRLSSRDVVILIGSADTGTAALDVSCGAYLQGENRFDRGQKLMDFMDATRPGHGHVERIVPGVGHSSRSMWTSEVGLDVLFGG